MEQYYATFQYYTSKGKRLAVFCRFVSPTEAELFTLTCSNQDQFDKKYARGVYEAYLNGMDPTFEFHKPFIELVTITPEERELQTLLNYCKARYYFFVSFNIPLDVLVNSEQLAGEREAINQIVYNDIKNMSNAKK